MLAQEFGQRQHDIGRGDAFLRLACELDADDVRQAHPRSAAQHHAFRFQSADANRQHAQRVDHRCVRVGADQRIGKGHALQRLHYRRHALQVDLVQDAIAWWDHVDVLERLLGPVDEIEAIFITTVFDRAILVERVGVEAAAFDGQRMVHHQLGRHDRVDQRRIAALGGNRVTQAGQVDQGGLAQDVVTHDARREPRKVQLALAFDKLAQRCVQRGRVAAAHQVFGQHTRGIRQLGVSAGRDGVNRGLCVEIIELGAG